jgi:hypothetical protein
MMTESLRISAPHFVAGAELDDNNVCVKAAPIIRLFRNKTKEFILAHCKTKGWKVELS